MHPLRQPLVLLLLAVSFAFAGDKETTSNGEDPGKKTAHCRCEGRTMEFREGGRCRTCKKGIDRRDKLCGKCAVEAGVCTRCTLRKESPKDASDEAGRPAWIKKGVCDCAPRPHRMLRPSSEAGKCEGCGGKTLSPQLKLCGECGEKSGACCYCQRMRSDPPEATREELPAKQ